MTNTVMDQQVTQLVSQGFQHCIAVLHHPISAQIQLVFPPLQDGGTTTGLLASALVAFLSASGNKCEIWINGKLMPIGPGLIIPKL